MILEREENQGGQQVFLLTWNTTHKESNVRKANSAIHRIVIFSNFLNMSTTSIKVQHFRVKVIFYLPMFNIPGVIALSIFVLQLGKNHYLVDSFIHVLYIFLSHEGYNTLTKSMIKNQEEPTENPHWYVCTELHGLLAKPQKPASLYDNMNTVIYNSSMIHELFHVFLHE